jgi:hypothetical protein
MFGNDPTRREYRKVAIGRAWNCRWSTQHCVDRRVGVIEGDTIDAIESRHVVFVRRIVAVPGDDVERRVVNERGPEAAEEFGDNVKLSVAIFEGCNRSLKVARIRQAICADGAQLRQAER